MAHAFLSLTILTFLGLGLAPALAAPEEKNLCLHDGRGDRATSSMQNCEIPADLDSLSGIQGMDGGYFLSMSNYSEFKASRRRVSEQADVNWVSEKGALARGILTGISGNVGTYKDPTPYWGMRLNRMSAMPGPYKTLPVVAHGECRYLYNLSQNDIFVPFRTKKEWVDFLSAADNGKLPGIFTNTCSYFCPGTCDNLIVFGPTSKEKGDWGTDKGSDNNWFRVELPYAPTGATWPTAEGDGKINRHEFNYACQHVDVVSDDSPGFCQGYTTVPGACDKKGNCEPDTEYCSSPGTRCVSSVKTWREVWEIPVGNVVAGVVHWDSNGAYHSGWGPAKIESSSKSVSKQVAGGTRPCQNSNFIQIHSGVGQICGAPKCVWLPGNPNKCGGGTSAGGGSSGPVGLGCD